MNIYIKLTVLLVLFLLFFTGLNIKVNNLKLRKDIIKLEEKIKHLKIKLEDKKMRFQTATTPKSIGILAKKHNVILKNLENVEAARHNKTKDGPLVKNGGKKP